MRHRAAKDEAACLEPHDLVDTCSGIGVQKLVDRHPKSARIGKERRHVAKEDPLMREVHDGADIVPDRLAPCGGGLARLCHLHLFV